MINNDNNFVITYNSKNFEYKKAIDAPGIPHNLETRDEEIINYICENIVLCRPIYLFDYEILNDNTLKILKANFPNYYDEINSYGPKMENGIAGKVVSCIGSGAFFKFINCKKYNSAFNNYSNRI